MSLSISLSLFISIDRRQINSILDRSTSSRIERRNSGGKLKSNLTQQDSLDDVPDMSNIQEVKHI
jgi:hypothetical protein